MSFRPRPRHVGEDREDGELVVVVPEKQRIAPQENEKEENNESATIERADEIAAPRGPSVV